MTETCSLTNGHHRHLSEEGEGSVGVFIQEREETIAITTHLSTIKLQSRRWTQTPSTLDLTFNIIQTWVWQETQHSVCLITDLKKKKDSQCDQYALWNRRTRINTSCQRELLMHVMNISASPGREEEEDRYSLSDEASGHPAFISPDTAPVSSTCSQLKEKNLHLHSEINTEDETAHLNFSTGFDFLFNQVFAVLRLSCLTVWQPSGKSLSFPAPGRLYSASYNCT